MKRSQKLKCWICNKTYRRHLKRHLTTTHVCVYNCFKCYICYKKCTSYFCWKVHLATHTSFEIEQANKQYIKHKKKIKRLYQSLLQH